MKYYIERNKWLRLKHNHIRCNNLCLVETVVDKACILGLINILVVFIKEEQAKAKKVENAGDKQYKKTNLSWVKKYFI